MVETHPVCLDNDCEGVAESWLVISDPDISLKVSL